MGSIVEKRRGRYRATGLFHSRDTGKLLVMGLKSEYIVIEKGYYTQ